MSQIAVHENWLPTDIQRMSVGDTQARIAVLRIGAADAAVIDIAAALKLEELKEARILVRFGDLIDRFQNQIIYASDRLIQNDPEAVRAFNAAWFETLAYARTHKDETVAFAEQSLGVEPGVAGRVYDELMPGSFFSKDGRFDFQTLSAMSKSFVEMGLLDHEVDLAHFVTEQFLPKGP